VEGAQFSCCLPCVIPTKSVIRVELEQQTYADGDIAHEPGTDCLDRIASLAALLEGAPPLPDRKLLWHCTLENLLDGTREGLEPNSGRLSLETKINGRTTRSNRRAGNTRGPNASRRNFDRQGRE
jgi:hypothetical protein